MAEYNGLEHCSSLYLQQHAKNPVHWQPWSDKVFEQAQREQKLVLVSIGYSSCHWCHVMEDESFEDQNVAETMNEHFICIKVDREERPDIDQYYMQAVQLMTKQGGWPLNCFTTPEGEPMFGGTYFPKEQWIHILETLAQTFEEDPKKINEYTQKLQEGMGEYDRLEENQNGKGVKLNEVLPQMIDDWSKNFDHEWGGLNRVPKFPIPTNYDFLLRYGFQNDDKALLSFVHNTLHHIARGGIFDQVGGGFSRYSTDRQWKVPHFEKMLYDNAQLFSLYSQAYQQSKDPFYQKIVFQTWDWLEREMKHPDGGFYSAIDADSEGEEGKFYVWTHRELNELFDKKQKEDLGDFFHLDETAEWERGKLILQRKNTPLQWAKKHNITAEEAEERERELIRVLFEAREQKSRPVTDTKRLTTWNALLLNGLCDAYAAFQDPEFYEEARDLGRWLHENTFRKAGGLWHKIDERGPDIEAFLDDYAALALAYINLYQITFDSAWFELAQSLIQYAQLHFSDKNNPLMYYSDEQFSAKKMRKKEVMDNVIPSSNAMIAEAMMKIGRIKGDPEMIELSKKSIHQVASRFEEYGPGFSNWAKTAMDITNPSYELAITGPDEDENRKTFLQNYLPNVAVFGGDADLPTLEGKRQKDKNYWYLCTLGSCQKPVQTWEEVQKQINKQ